MQPSVEYAGRPADNWSVTTGGKYDLFHHTQISSDASSCFVSNAIKRMVPCGSIVSVGPIYHKMFESDETE